MIFYTIIKKFYAVGLVVLVHVMHVGQGILLNLIEMCLWVWNDGKRWGDARDKKADLLRQAEYLRNTEYISAIFYTCKTNPHNKTTFKRKWLLGKVYLDFDQKALGAGLLNVSTSLVIG